MSNDLCGMTHNRATYAGMSERRKTHFFLHDYEGREYLFRSLMAADKWRGIPAMSALLITQGRKSKAESFVVKGWTVRISIEITKAVIQKLACFYFK